MRRASIPLRIQTSSWASLLSKSCLLSGLGVQHLVPALEKGRVITGPVVELAAVELDDPGRQFFQEHAVVGDENERAAGARQECFQPADRVDVEMVGRFVEKQDVGLVDNGLSQQHAPLHSGRQVFKGCFGVQAHPGNDRLHAMIGARRGMARVFVQSGGDMIGDRTGLVARDILRQARDAEALLADDLHPRRARSRPVSSRRRVLLPSPLRPSKQTRSPGSICSSTWSSRRGPPKARLTFRRLNSAMNAVVLSSRPDGFAGYFGLARTVRDSWNKHRLR